MTRRIGAAPRHIVGRSPRVASSILFYGLILFGAWWWMLKMPGRSADGPLPPLPDDLGRLANELYSDVQTLAGEIGERNVPDNPQPLEAAENYIESSLQSAGYLTQSQSYNAGGHACRNIVADLPGVTQPDEIVVIGAHYDTVPGSPGADDNASGVAALLSLARSLRRSPARRTLRFVAFTNEEPPWFWQPEMGSLVYAKECRARHDPHRGNAELGIRRILY
ncbi:MAG TPA: M20/M25/M40 family metallo-hydrolase [Bryobacteraceae bacterium]|nr:M20/M25/M40 family metallo-hydrolase [Bryobacteraceae bacterium]